MHDHALVWFRQDLRIADNPALAGAAKLGLPVIPLFIHAPDEEGPWPPGAASNWWLHHALAALDKELGHLGLPLIVRSGPTLDTLKNLINSHSVRAVFWNRRYEPDIIERDEKIERSLRDGDVQVEIGNAALLYEPHEIANRSEQPYRVFTPFWKRLYGLPARAPVTVDGRRLQPPEPVPESAGLEELKLLPDHRWDTEFYNCWAPGLKGAHKALQRFVDGAISDYQNERDCPAHDGTSRLSPYLHFGQLGPRQVWRAVQEAGSADTQDGHAFLRELAWREFAQHLLAHFPHTPTEPLNEKFRDFPWQPDEDQLRAWQQGRTGYPLVDAGMRQLWRTGWMHNRVRMVVASFLVKHLLQPWQQGARWFWDTLVDADLANNTMGWQWSAGCGADAAPYFRIFNPTLQGEKFDPNGRYVKTFVPELERLPDRYIHRPWEAPREVLDEAGVGLGEDYPQPIIPHSEGRQRALDALAENKA